MRLFVSKRSIKPVSIATTPGKHFFSGANAIDRDEAFGDRRIKAGGALECRATGVIEKTWPAVDPDACRFLRPCVSASPTVVVVVLVLGWGRSRCERMDGWTKDDDD